MKNYPKIVSLLAGLLIWGIAASCAAAVYYNTIEQSAGSSEQIKSATEFKVKPIDFSAINPKDLGYNNSEEWNTDSKDVPKAFADSFPILLKEAGIENKKVIAIKRDELVSKGIIVDVAVKKLILNGIISAVNLTNIYAMSVIPMPPVVRNYFPQLSMLTAGLVILTHRHGEWVSVAAYKQPLTTLPGF